MDDKERDAYLLEILDRMARIETKLDDQAEMKQTVKMTADSTQKNANRIDSIERRFDDYMQSNDDKWDTDRNEKRTIWITVLAGSFGIIAAIAGASITLLFN